MLNRDTIRSAGETQGVLYKPNTGALVYVVAHSLLPSENVNGAEGPLPGVHDAWILKVETRPCFRSVKKVEDVGSVLTASPEDWGGVVVVAEPGVSTSDSCVLQTKQGIRVPHRVRIYDLADDFEIEASGNRSVEETATAVNAVALEEVKDSSAPPVDAVVEEIKELLVLLRVGELLSSALGPAVNFVMAEIDGVEVDLF
ncbi:hypothetical protein PG989_006700 [Apiospora arundinis]